MTAAFDTNVFVYAIDKRDAGKHVAALALLERTLDGVLLWQVACEFVAACRKLAQFGVTEEEAWANLADFKDSFDLVLPTAGVLDRAKVLQLEHQWSYWDALLIGACQEAGVRRLYSEDVPGHSPPGELEIVNPFA